MKRISGISKHDRDRKNRCFENSRNTGRLVFSSGKGYTALIRKDKSGIYWGNRKEVPGAWSQGTSLNRFIYNLRDAVKMIQTYNNEKG